MAKESKVEIMVRGRGRRVAAIEDRSAWLVRGSPIYREGY